MCNRDPLGDLGGRWQRLTTATSPIKLWTSIAVALPHPGGSGWGTSSLISGCPQANWINARQDNSASPITESCLYQE